MKRIKQSLGASGPGDLGLALALCLGNKGGQGMEAMDTGSNPTSSSPI